MGIHALYTFNPKNNLSITNYSLEPLTFDGEYWILSSNKIWLEGNIFYIDATTYGSVDATVVVTTAFSNGMVYSFECPFQINVACLVRGTEIEVVEIDRKTGKKKRRKKKIEDLTYDDEVLVWDFDKGEFTTAKILWLKKKEATTQYDLIKFSDGSELKTINQHRIFNKEQGKFTYPMTEDTPIGTTTFNNEGKEIKLISKEIVEEYVEYYNVISEYHMNVFANGILTSCRLSNLYPIKDMKYVKEDREIIGIEKFGDIPEEYYYGLRLGEQPVDINRDNAQKFGNTLVEYVMNLIRNVKEK